MFGIGMPEMLVLLAVALIVFGPKKLPELAKSLGRALGELKRATSDLKDNIEQETGVDEIRQNINEVKDDIKSQVDLAGSSPTPSEPKDTKTSKEPSNQPLDHVKTEFDKMNRATDTPIADLPADKDPTYQDTKKK